MWRNSISVESVQLSESSPAAYRGTSPNSQETNCIFKGPVKRHAWFNTELEPILSVEKINHGCESAQYNPIKSGKQNNEPPPPRWDGSSQKTVGLAGKLGIIYHSVPHRMRDFGKAILSTILGCENWGPRKNARKIGHDFIYCTSYNEKEYI